MNLQTQISNNLWLEIQSTYQAKNYSHAVIDAMQYLSNVLRERAGIDGDGQGLAGAALGGDSPRLRINKLQTVTEKDEQKGLESILRGMYQGIRNPRSHESIVDTQETADAIICFINYLLSKIEKSEEPFSLSKFLDKVFDSEFVNSARYAELIVDEIPTNKQFDTLVEIYRNKRKGNILNIGLVIHTLINKLREDQVKQYLEIVSEEIGVITDEDDIGYNLHLLPPNLWTQLAEAPKLRIENKILRTIKDGIAYADYCEKGALALWAKRHLEYFACREEVGRVFIDELYSTATSSRHYAIMFINQFPLVLLGFFNRYSCIDAIKECIKVEDVTVYKALVENISSFPKDWINAFVEAMKDFTDKERPAFIFRDGTPFLKGDERWGEEIPF